MKPFFRSVSTPALAVTTSALIAVALELSAESIPDIVWRTNAHSYAVTSVAFSRDCLALVSGSLDRTLQVWAVTNAQSLRFLGNPYGVLAVALSPDGSYVVAGDGDGRTQMWRVSDGVRLLSGQNPNDLVYSADYSNDGTWIAFGTAFSRVEVDNLVLVEGNVFEGHEREVFTVRFSPDSHMLASGGADRTARLWRLADGKLLRTLTHGDTVYSVDFSPDGTMLASASADGAARLWRVADGEVVRVIEGGGGNTARFSADGKLLLTVNAGTIHVWRVADGRLLQSYTNANAGPLAVASNGKYFAYGRTDGAVVLAWMPLWISEISQTNNEITLRWEGGRGRYQLQACRSLGSSQWQNLGPPTTNTTVTSACMAPIFYRVQSLPNP